MKRTQIAITAGTLALMAGLANAQTLRTGELIARVGDPLPGSNGWTVTLVQYPAVDGLGRVGFVGRMQDPDTSTLDTFVFYNDSIIHRHLDVTEYTLTGQLGPMGVSNDGNFAANFSVDGRDSIWSSYGLIARATEPAPPFPGEFWAFGSRPMMNPIGDIYWGGGLTANEGSTSAQRRAFMKRSPDGTYTALAESNRAYGDYFIVAGESFFNYAVSDNSQHHMFRAQTTEQPTNAAYVMFVNGEAVLQSTMPAGDGTNWANGTTAFRIMSINNAGNWVVGGQTNPANGRVIAYNGDIVFRASGIVVDGVTLPTTAEINGLGINNRDEVLYAFTWSVTGQPNPRHVFVGYGPQLQETSVAVLSLGDTLDVNGDGVADYVVSDIDASTIATARPITFGDDGAVALKVSLQAILGEGELGPAANAIIQVAVPRVAPDVPVCPADFDNDGNVNTADITAFLSAWFADRAAGTLVADFDGNNVVNTADITAFLSAWFDARAGGC